MASHPQFKKDLYKLLHLTRTATSSEIKQSYHKIAHALHPDKHNGCSTKTSEFKVVTEAYNILSNYKLRLEYDRWLDDVIVGENGQVVRRRKEGASRAAERNPFYRKVYSPAAPPGMKTFDRQRHYGMWFVFVCGLVCMWCMKSVHMICTSFCNDSQ